MDLALKQSDGHCLEEDPVTLEPKEEVGTRVRVWLVLNRQSLLYQIFFLNLKLQFLETILNDKRRHKISFDVS